MKREERYHQVLDFFRREAGPQTTELEFGSAFQLLCATLLSAQCTDRRVNAITPALFARFPDARSMAQASVEAVYELVRSVSYPNAKARHLVEMARMLTDQYGGEVPSEAAELVKLPGVGRKTANVVGAVIWQKEVMPVDTHVFRVSNRIGLTNRSKTPLQTELTLEKYIPSHLLPTAHHWLILHGRYVCTARAPKCAECGVSTWCRKYAEDNKRSKTE